MKIAVIGGGASGQIAAGEAAFAGADVTLFEKNEKLGKKLYISGKGRCNLTNDAEREDFFRAVTHNPKFLFSAFSCFNNQDIQNLIERYGVPLKTERGGRVFPVSDKSSDILKALKAYLSESGADIRLNTFVERIETENGAVTGVWVNGRMEAFDAVIIATGGVSYPQTGSDGDGLRFAETLGHSVNDPKPSLVGLTTEEKWPGTLSGLTLKNVRITAKRENKILYKEQGELLLTHSGVSGPLILTLSSLIADKPKGVIIEMDLKPALDEKTLDQRLCREISGNMHKSVQNSLHALLPERLLTVILSLAEVDGGKHVDSLTKQERHRIVDSLKCIRLHVCGTQPMDEAIITRGGVKVNEVNSSTMESKLIKGLYFAGEVLDVDAVTGGYNLQIAWSTGALAGRNAGGKQGKIEYCN